MGRILSLLVMALTPAALSGQFQADPDFFLFHKSYVTFGEFRWLSTGVDQKAPGYLEDTERPPIGFEAMVVAPTIHLIHRFQAAHVEEGAGRGFNLSLTPRFRLRSLRGDSDPVRSISFIPRVEMQYLWSIGPGAVANGPRAPADAPSGRRQLLGINLLLGHHSNGGSGCGFTDETLVEDRGCVADDPLLPLEEREVQVDTGNFSTNFVELGVFARRGSLQVSPGGRPYWDSFVTVGLSAQWHPKGWGIPLSGGAEGAFRHHYDVFRQRLDMVSGKHLSSLDATLKARIAAEYHRPRVDPFPGARRWRWEVEAYIMRDPDDPQGGGMPRGIGIGARYVLGQDYYNLHYVRDIQWLSLLVVVDPTSAFLRR